MCKTEQWKIISGYDGTYEVSDQGHVKRVKPSRDRGYSPVGYILQSNKPNNRGYISLSLRRADNSGHDTRSIHHLVLEAFVGPRPKGYVTNHKNSNKADNRVENLEWVSQAYNVEHAIKNGHFAFIPMGERNPAAKLTADQVREIRQTHSEIHCPYRVLSEQFGVTRAMIGRIVRRVAWRHIS